MLLCFYVHPCVETVFSSDTDAKFIDLVIDCCLWRQTGNAPGHQRL